MKNKNIQKGVDKLSSKIVKLKLQYPTRRSLHAYKLKLLKGTYLELSLMAHTILVINLSIKHLNCVLEIIVTVRQHGEKISLSYDDSLDI